MWFIDGAHSRFIDSYQYLLAKVVTNTHLPNIVLQRQPRVLVGNQGKIEFSPGSLQYLDGIMFIFSFASENSTRLSYKFSQYLVVSYRFAHSSLMTQPHTRLGQQDLSKSFYYSDKTPSRLSIVKTHQALPHLQFRQISGICQGTAVCSGHERNNSVLKPRGFSVLPCQYANLLLLSVL